MAAVWIKTPQYLQLKEVEIKGENSDSLAKKIAKSQT